MSSQALQTQKTFFSESKLLLTVAIPLVLGGIVETSVGFFSNIFLAHLGTDTLAAGALVNWVFNTIMVIMWGTFSAVSTLVARYYGAKDYEQISCVFYSGLLLAIALILPSLLLLWNLAPVLLFFGQKQSLVTQAEPYLHALSWAVIPEFILNICLQFVAGIGRTKINLMFSLLFVPLCIFFNYGLMFGKFGLPALGIAGIGWGTTITFCIIAVGFILYFCLNKSYKTYLKFPPSQKLKPALKEILQVGLPLGLMYFVEVGFFLVATVIMGFISKNALTANQVALQFYWVFSILIFGISQGITIRVGHSIGQNDRQAIHYATYLGLFYATALMFLSAILYWFFAESMIGIDFKMTAANAPIIQLAKGFLAIAALLQIVEAVRFSFFGALRGLKDTRFTLLVSFFIYWVVTLPLGCLLAFAFGMQGYGIWWATVIGQLAGTPWMIWRYHRKLKEYLL